MEAKILVLLLTLLLSSCEQTQDYCKNVTKCQCEVWLDEIDLNCNIVKPLINSDPQNLNVMFTQKREKYLTIDCFQLVKMNDSVFDTLSELKLGPIDQIQFKFCLFPSMSVKLFIEKLQIKQVEKLIITRSNQLIGELSAPVLDNLPFLTYLNIMIKTNLTGLHKDVFRGTPNLEYLFLRGNKIENLHPDVFQYLPKLVQLDLGGNRLTNFNPRLLRNLTYLKGLNIDNNDMRNLSRQMFLDLSNLKTLDISSNNLTDLPSDVFNDLTNLSILHANTNVFKTFPKHLFSKTKHLKTLKIVSYENTLIDLPEEFLANLQQLTHVTIRQSSIKQLPSNLFSNSTKLIEIKLAFHEQMTELPVDLFRDCQLLETLELNDNRLTNLPDKIFGSLIKLNYLNLRGNKLENISRNVFDGLINLKKLDMSQNLLKHIEGFGREMQSRLEVVNLSDNLLELDNDQSLLQYSWNLEELNLSRNRIKQFFNNSIVSMENLKYLNLRENNFTILSNNILHSTLSDNLIIDLSLNQISMIDLSSLELGAILQHEDTSERRNPIEIILTDNPIDCKCINYAFIKYKTMSTQVSDLFRIELSQLKCDDSDSPVTPEEFHCPTDTCPDNCSCSYLPFKSSSKVDCSSRGLHQFPQSLPTRYYFGRNENDFRSIESLHLILRNNSIMYLPDDTPGGYDLVTDLDLSANRLTIVKVNYFTQLERLDLSNNSLTFLDEDVLNYLSTSSHLRQSSLKLSDNPWQCSCNSSEFYEFVFKKHNKLINAENIICKGWNKSLNKMTLDEYCPTLLSTITIVCILFGVAGLMFGLLTILFFRYEREIKAWLFSHHLLLCFITEEDLDKERLYDAFVSFAEEDDPFVLQTLIPELEKSFKIRYHLRDFTPGNWIHNEIIESVKMSRRTIIVLSSHFLNSHWCKLEFQAAHCDDAKNNRARVIILIYGDLPPEHKLEPEMEAYMSLNTYIKWGDPWFWDKLKYALPHAPSKLTKKLETKNNEWANIIVPEGIQRWSDIPKKI